MRSAVTASIDASPITAAGDVRVGATESATITASRHEPRLHLGGLRRRHRDQRRAREREGLDPGRAGQRGARVTVAAANTASLSALARSQIEGFDKTFGAVLAFNTIGWKPSNILFNAVDAILGDPLISSAFNGEQPSEALAWIRDAAITATGAVSVTAVQAATLESEVGNEGIAAAQLDGVLTKGSATDGVSGGGAIASNKVNTRAQAWIDHTTATEVVRAASITVDARDAASIESRSTVVQQAIVENTAQGIAAYIDQILPLDYDYTTRSGSRTLRTGDQVRVGTGYDTTKGDVGSIYRYLGAAATLDLGTLSYKTDTVNWKKLGTGTTAEELYPGIGNLTKSDARAIGVLVVLNDLRASAEAWVDRTDLQAATIAIGATEAAQLLAEVTSTVAGLGRLVLRHGHGARRQRHPGHQRGAVEGGRDGRPQRARRRGHGRARPTRPPSTPPSTRRRRPATPASASCWPSTRSAGSRRTSSSTRSTRCSATR